MALNRSVIVEEIKSAGLMTVTQLREALADKGIKVGTTSARCYLTTMSEEVVLQISMGDITREALGQYFGSEILDRELAEMDSCFEKKESEFDAMTIALDAFKVIFETPQNHS